MGVSPVEQAVRLVGRDRELDLLRALLREHHLVTVTGTGGVGKTSLALAVRGRLDGARFVVCELADVQRPEAVRHAVAARLGARLREGEPASGAVPPPDDGSEVLIVLDNCEHVLDAAVEVVEQLLTAGPHVRVLVTSREPLRLAAEHVLRLDPLAVPASAESPEATEAAAVVLFAERAQHADPRFALDERTLPAVVRICAGLDGVPLALEIAAARVPVLSVDDIAARLGHRFSLLRAGTRRTPDRHKSLRAAVDWSYDLLDPVEQRLLTTLAVYPGGCDLAAATAAGEALGLDDAAVLDVLGDLVAKSMVTTTPAPGGTRYGMLETLREYSLDRLASTGETARVRDRHADYYAHLGRRLRALLLDAWTLEARPLFDEFDNLRAALTWTIAHDESADRSFDLLAPMWYLALQYSAAEIAEYADAALARWPDRRHPRWAEVAGTAATARVTLEDYAPARPLAQSAAEATWAPIGSAFGFCALAGIAGHADDDPDAALAHLDRADEAAAAGAFEPLRCDVLGRRAQTLAQAGRKREALATAEQALALARRQGNAYEQAWDEHLIGLLLIPDEPAAAREWLLTALTESRGLSYIYGINSAQRGLAAATAALGELAAAAEIFAEPLTGFVRSGHLGERWNTVAAMLPLLLAAGRRQSAATLLAGLDSAGTVVFRIHAPLLGEVRRDLAAELAAPTVVARGRALGLEQLLVLARQELQLLRRGAVGEAPEQEVSAEARPAEPRPAELRRVGPLWEVTFAGSSAHLPDLRGLHDLARLLANPGQDVPALDLVATSAPSGTSVPAQRGAPAGDEELRTPGDLGEQIDARARAAYADRIRELQGELDDADRSGDVGRSSRLQEELDFLTAELTSAYGLRGPRRTGDPAEKARAAVTARIRAAIRKIGSAHPELGRHLDRSVRTGRFCSYRPEDATTWTVIR
ncbi:MAG TPA: hypothetical protein VLA97_17530 [Nocardioidaceae bacterium]|nr:hypothetical protein [Nocardioidaceae bacterium]